MKKDPYKHKQTYENWKEAVKDRIPDISKANSDIILKYLKDMENGINISIDSIRGGRSYARLNSLKNRMIFFSKKFKELFDIDDLTKATEEQVLSFFNYMKNGTIIREDKKQYQSVETYGKIFKAFWHWHMKVNKKNRE